MKILGIDYGSKRVGVAVSDEGGVFAFPKSVLSVSHNLVAELSALATAEGVSTIVLGESRNFGGEENIIMPAIHKLKEELEQIGFRVVLEPEYFSSAEASRFQGEREDLDASAAAIILQRYLDKHPDSR